MSSTGEVFEKFVEIVAVLRHPETGCPWDREQTHESLKQYAIEETYELLDAIDHAPDEIKNELGDVLLQIVLHSQIASEDNRFSVKEVIEAISDKMVERHPHVFGDETANTSEEVTQKWEEIKNKDTGKSRLDGIPNSLPALLTAHKIGARVSAVFELPGIEGARAKIEEELNELLEDIDKGSEQEKIEDEFGDLLFALAQFARLQGFDAETALIAANQKFGRRFRFVEEKAGKEFSNLSPETLFEYWKEAKVKTDG